jgi:hypothetical protein
MDVQFYRGNNSLPEIDNDGLYFTRDGKLFSGYSQKYIGENLGINNTNDAYGCYWKSIDFTNKKITLSSTQPVGSDDKYNSSYGIAVNVPSDWAVNDRISIVNDDRYDVCCTIESISGNTITVSSLPFTSLDDPVVAGNALEIDDYMILNVDKNTGPVKLNETAIVGGTGSKALGNASYAMGWECIAYGKSATTFGIGTEAGFAAFATGKLNKSSGLHSFTQGLENEATQSGSSAFGRRNISGARDTFVTGENNITSASTSAVFGKDNHIESTGIRTVVFGNLNTVTSGQNSLVGGYQNTLTGSNSILFGGGNTSSGTYDIVAGTGNTISTFKDSKGNNVTPDSMAVFGQGHTIAGKHGLVAGYLNTATGGNSVFTALGRNITIGANNTHAIGRNLTTKTTEGQVVLGKYNNVDETGGKILVVGAGTAEKPLNVFTITSAGTGTFANNCYAKSFYENGTSLTNKYVPQTITINNKTLNNNITLTSADIMHSGYLTNINTTDDCTLSETLDNLDSWIGEIDTNHTHEIYVNLNECSTIGGTEELLDDAFYNVDVELGSIKRRLNTLDTTAQYALTFNESNIMKRVHGDTLDRGTYRGIYIVELYHKTASTCYGNQLVYLSDLTIHDNACVFMIDDDGGNIVRVCFKREDSDYKIYIYQNGQITTDYYIDMCRLIMTESD